MRFRSTPFGNLFAPLFGIPVVPDEQLEGPLYLVLGYGHDANYEDRTVVVYVGLELTDAHTGARLAVRTVEDFFAIVDPATGATVDAAEPTERYPRRFTYLGPGWERRR